MFLLGIICVFLLHIARQKWLKLKAIFLKFIIQNKIIYYCIAVGSLDLRTTFLKLPTAIPLTATIVEFDLLLRLLLHHSIIKTVFWLFNHVNS